MKNHQMIRRTNSYLNEIAARCSAKSARKEVNPVSVQRAPSGGINGLVVASNLWPKRGFGHESTPSSRLMGYSRTTFPSRNKTSGTESTLCGSIFREPAGTTPPVMEELGLLLMDSSLNPISWNEEAIQILSYPELPQDVKCLDAFLTQTIRAKLLNDQSPPSSPYFLTEFVSGRRRYRSRFFRLYRHLRGPSEPVVIELVLERSAPELAPLSVIAKQFNFSPRERQAVEWLLQGLSSKEIADRMEISCHTVNSFIRTIMIKMGVSNRSGILGKIITASIKRDSVTPQQSNSASGY
jgi:DNA-binding CsgD family transcriptional regulator